jgi:hypothetical protein
MARISEKLRVAVLLSHKRGYHIAHEAGVHPSTLSKILCGIERIKSGDHRVISIGNVLGVPPEDCFGGALVDQSNESRKSVGN